MYTYEACRVVSRPEWCTTDPIRYNRPSMRMNNAVLIWESLVDRLMNESLGKLGLIDTQIVSWRRIVDIEFEEVMGRTSQRRWLRASHEEGRIIERVSNADMAKAGQDLLVVKDVICSNKQR